MLIRRIAVVKMVFQKTKDIPEELQRWARCHNCRADYIKEMGDRDVYCPPCDRDIFGKEYLPEKPIRKCRGCKKLLPGGRYFTHVHCERILFKTQGKDLELVCE